MAIMKRRWIGFFVLNIALLGITLWAVGQKPSSSSPASASIEAWQKEFEEVCSKTQDAMADP